MGRAGSGGERSGLSQADDFPHIRTALASGRLDHSAAKEMSISVSADGSDGMQPGGPSREELLFASDWLDCGALFACGMLEKQAGARRLVPLAPLALPSSGGKLTQLIRLSSALDDATATLANSEDVSPEADSVGKQGTEEAIRPEPGAGPGAYATASAAWDLLRQLTDAPNGLGDAQQLVSSVRSSDKCMRACF